MPVSECLSSGSEKQAVIFPGISLADLAVGRLDQLYSSKEGG